LLQAATAGLAVVAGGFATRAASTESETGPGGLQEVHDFYGRHQAGIVTPQQPFGVIVAFNCLAENRSGLERLCRLLTTRITKLTTGGPVPESDGGYPPPDSGMMGKTIPPDGLTITLSVGASLFDERYGLQGAKPARLIAMERFRNDALNADYCHGDILLQFCANRQETALHALRDIIKNTPDLLTPRWKLEGHVAPKDKRADGEGTPRNHLGFKDGTANPAAGDDSLMKTLIWTKGGQGGEPAWTEGGSYHVVRIIRNFVERWDRTPLNDQERIIGRHKYSGAPIGGVAEMDEPDFVTSPNSAKTAHDAHIRLANPRDAKAMATRILRRGYNYSLGLSKSGQMDMGLLFVCFQSDLDQGFRAIQKRLDGEALEEYIKPIGGGYFFALPGVVSKEGFLGEGLLAG
jgi:deferrochelatase/peroxidase EfeB